MIYKWFSDLQLSTKFDINHEFTQFSLQNLQLIFLIYFIGVLLASYVFVLEILVGRNVLNCY